MHNNLALASSQQSSQQSILRALDLLPKYPMRKCFHSIFFLSFFVSVDLLAGVSCRELFSPSFKRVKDSALAQMSERLLIELDQSRFYSVRPLSKKKKDEMRLAKIEKYNEDARPEEAIKYKAVRETVVRKPWDGDNRDLLTFEFRDITPEKFQVISNLYGGHSTLIPRPGKNTYTLTDFMPPLIQALEGHALVSYRRDAPILNETAQGKRKLGREISTAMAANCWSTAYEILRARSFSGKQGKILESFSTFIIDDISVERAFKSVTQIQHKQIFSKGDKIELPSFAEGSVIMIKPLHTNSNRRAVPVLEHVVTSIDQGLVFEKADAGSVEPYRFIALQESVDHYFNRVDFDIRKIQIEVLRPTGTAPPPREQFGGYENGFDEVWRMPLVGNLNSVFLLSRWRVSLDSKEFYNSFDMIVDVPLAQDRNSGRYQLAPEAFKPEHFDQSEVMQRALESP